MLNTTEYTKMHITWVDASYCQNVAEIKRLQIIEGAAMMPLLRNPLEESANRKTKLIGD